MEEGVKRALEGFLKDMEKEGAYIEEISPSPCKIRHTLLL